MTEQPETMVEYHFRKLSHTLLVVATMFFSIMFLSTAGVVVNSDPVLSAMFVFGSVLMLAVAHGMVADGYVRRVLNYVFRTDVSGLERPDERHTTETLADD